MSTTLPPLFLLGGEEGGGQVEAPTKVSKRGELTGPQLLEISCWERGG